MKYIPKGGMCATCIHTDRNCMGLKFSKMPIISRTEDLIIVKCTEYGRKNYPIETPKKWIGLDEIIKEYSNDPDFCLHLARELLPESYVVVELSDLLQIEEHLEFNDKGSPAHNIIKRLIETQEVEE